MAKKRIVIDPVTRIEGHLRIEVETQDGIITDAWSTGTLWRGVEAILKGNDARDAWLTVLRICGVCTVSQGIGSVRAVENALKMKIPLNAQYIRNIMLGAHTIVDNLIHFYIFCGLDWFDIHSAALKASPARAAALAQSCSSWRDNSTEDMRKTQEKLKKLVNSGQMGIFADGYSGHQEMTLPPEVNLILATHYFQSLDYQRIANKIVTVLGSKTPHIQNLAVGGVANPINPDSAAVLTIERMQYVKKLIDDLKEFINEAYNTDVALLAAYYPEWNHIGKGQGNFLSHPEFPIDEAGDNCVMPGGYIEGKDFTKFRKITSLHDKFIEDNVLESVKHSYFKGSSINSPFVLGDLEPVFDPKDTTKYSWVKSPYFKNKTAEPGPTASVYAMHLSNYQPCIDVTNRVFKTIEKLGKEKYTLENLDSTMGRMVSRSIRVSVVQSIINDQYDLLIKNIQKGDFATFYKPHFPKGEIRGMGVHEAPRGALAHWVRITDGYITSYEATIPTTWLASPRGHNGEYGAYEYALLGHKIADPKRPLEIIRTIHSYDPCMACSAHILSPDGKTYSKVKVQ